MDGRQYVCIDLKSFYASVECVRRGLDPMTAHLVVADAGRTEKTICLAVSPALKAHGIPGRPRLFEVVQRVAQVNAGRRARAPGHVLAGEATDSGALAADPSLALGYIVAQPQMARYREVSTLIYGIYTQYVAPEDIHVYSVDEVFMDVTDYLSLRGLTARELAMEMIRSVLAATGITATAGIGTNLYLAKIAMDIQAKRCPADKDGVRIAELTEDSYRALLWSHRPLTDFWRVGRGIAARLEGRGLFTMGDVARCSVNNEDLLYQLLGVNAELLIDHAWGWEPCTLADIKSYRPATSSLCSAQVLSSPYPHDKTRLIVREMAEQMALALVERGQVTDQLTLTVDYDVSCLSGGRPYAGPVTEDRYGRRVPKPAHGSCNLPRPTASTRLLTEAALSIFSRVADPALTTRRVTVGVQRLQNGDGSAPAAEARQLDLFTDEDAQQAEEAALARERRMQRTVLALRQKYGKNAVVKAMDLEEGATTIARNGQIGGHKA